MIRKFFVLLLLGSLITLVITLISLCIGSFYIPLGDIISTLFQKKGTIDEIIIFKIRLPRIILGFAVGSSLALCGVILQALFRNPLVEPYTLGISSGACLAVALSIALGFYILPLSGLIGGGAVLFLLYILSMRHKIINLSNLLLLGIMISFICSGLIMLILSISKEEDLKSIIFWIMGGLEEPNVNLIKIMTISSFLGLFLSYPFSLSLNAFSLSEETAINLGINIERTKKALFFLVGTLIGLCVSICGIIGFVGLVIPHICRYIVGYDNRFLIILSWFMGGGFLVICDTIARVIILPNQLPVGVITGIIGGVLFSYLLIRNR